MISKNGLLAILAFTLQGCICWDADYTPKKPISPQPVALANRYQLTYSIVLQAQRPDAAGFPDVNRLREKVERALSSAGVFSGVTYSEKPSADIYHISFDFKQSDINHNGALDAESVASEIIGVFPVSERLSLDASAILSCGGKIVSTSVKTEEFRCVIWLPLLPFSVFADASSAWTEVCDSVVNASVSELVAAIR